MTGKEAKNAYMREYNKRNKGKSAEYSRRWRRRNPDKVKEYQERHWENKAAQMNEHKTNLERIKNMSAAKLAEIIKCPHEVKSDVLNNYCSQYSSCSDCTWAWLESEADNGK